MCLKKWAVHIVSGSLFFCPSDCCRRSMGKSARWHINGWASAQGRSSEHVERRDCADVCVVVEFTDDSPRGTKLPGCGGQHPPGWKVQIVHAPGGGGLWRFGEVRRTRFCGRDRYEILQESCRCSARRQRTSERLAQRETRCQSVMP